MYEHSIRVPRLYKIAAKIAKEVKEEGASLKQLVYQKKHPNVKALYALVAETLQNLVRLDTLIVESKILDNESRLDIWLARILITELLWGKKKLPGDSKPVQTILSYHENFLQCLPNLENLKKPKTKKVLKPRYVRVNTLVISVEEVVNGFRNEGWTLTRCGDGKDYAAFLATASSMGSEQFMVDMHIKELLLFPTNTHFYHHASYLNGEILLQDKASCLAPFLLNPTIGSTVLDMCAAPGMKCSQLAAMVGETGCVFAVERDASRYKTLCDLMEKIGAVNVTSLNKDVMTVTESDCPDVEYILVDPSCSGSGILDRFELDQDANYDRYRFQKLAGFQVIMLKYALNNFPKAKRVVYSTCSIYPEENEEVIKQALKQSPNFKLVDIKSSLKNMWYNFGSSDYELIGEKCLYARSDRDLCNGFFVALFQRLDEGEVNEFYVPRKQLPESPENEDENENDSNEKLQSLNKKKNKKKENKHVNNEYDNENYTNAKRRKENYETINENEYNENIDNEQNMFDDSSKQNYCKKRKFDELHHNEENEDNAQNEKNSKKKRKQKNDVQDNANNIQLEIEDKRKKSKKHKLRNSENDDIPNEEITAKKKHKFKKNDMEYENVNNFNEECTEKHKKSKKKIDDNQLNEDFILKKNHKSKKYDTGDENISKSQAETTKKKKKSKKNKLENDDVSKEIDDNLENEKLLKLKTKDKKSKYKIKLEENE